VYTFTLRPDLKFASGAALTARDVAASWERALDPATGSSTARTYLGDILGAADKLDKKADTIRGLKVIDERTLQVTLDAPRPYFLGKLTYPTAAVLNVQTVKPKAEDWVWQPDPSGPYRILEHRKDLLLTFERNPGYFAPAGIRYVAYNLEPGGSAVSLYEDGEIDMVGVSSTNWKRVSDPAAALSKEFQSVVTLCSGALVFDMNRPPFDDRNVRKAFTLATDRAAYIEQLTQGTTQIPANGTLPPSMPGHLADRPETPFDDGGAKQALAASKYAGSLPEITIGAPGYADSNRRDIGILVDQWQKTLGIKVKVLYIDPVNYSKAARESSANLLLQGWCADYPDPQNFLDVLYHSKSEFNIAKTSLPALDALLEKARSGSDVSARLALYQQAETLLLDEYALLPLTYSVQGMLIKPWVKGFTLAPMGVVNLRLLLLEGKKP
jgi:oligopeptide transport system substrate-binding protein